ncbi:hydrogenase [candidate division KSB1 bacterium]|nr:hydrogenase [candidate division KSB1 bacterium]
MKTDAKHVHSVQANRLIQLGLLLFLFGLFNGFLISSQLLPKVVRAAHLLALMGGTFLIAIGLLWPRLRLSLRLLRLNFALAIYGFYGGWLLYLIAGMFGLGAMFPIAADGVRGPETVEFALSTTFGTVALAMIWLCGSLIWGLRSSPEDDES